MPGNDASTIEREAEFHDRWASEIDVEDIDVRVHFEGSTAPENRFIVSQLGDLSGKRVLDLGCGAGENSVYFALKGARCVASDISPGMVETADRLAKRYGVEIEGKVLNAAETGLPAGSFDIVYAANLLHHVEPAAVIREAHRLLVPGGRLCFWDPLKHNPLINVYRRMASGVRTADERPLDIGVTREVRQLFSDVRHETFWIFSLWIFLRFYLIERVDPNRERYWKKILFEEERLRATYLRLEKLDRIAKRLPFLERMAWNIAVVATK